MRSPPIFLKKIVIYYFYVIIKQLIKSYQPLGETNPDSPKKNKKKTHKKTKKSRDLSCVICPSTEKDLD